MHRESCIMNRRGFSLIELLIIVAIVSILAVALGFQFSGWIGSYNVESQTKNMYIDLMNARARAMGRNRAHFVVVTNSNYQIFEDTNENGSCESCASGSGADSPVPGFTSAKTFDSNYQASSGTGTITMDTRGMISPTTTIQFNNGGYSPDYDCIIVEATRIKMGKWNGTSCDAK